MVSFDDQKKKCSIHCSFIAEMFPEGCGWLVYLVLFNILTTQIVTGEKKTFILSGSGSWIFPFHPTNATGILSCLPLRINFASLEIPSTIISLVHSVWSRLGLGASVREWHTAPGFPWLLPQTAITQVSLFVPLTLYPHIAFHLTTHAPDLLAGRSFLTKKEYNLWEGVQPGFSMD